MRNTNYFKPGLPYMDEIRWAILTDEQAVVAAATTGRIDDLGQAPVTKPTVDSIVAKGNFKLEQALGPWNQGVGFNLNNPKLADRTDTLPCGTSCPTSQDSRGKNLDSTSAGATRTVHRVILLLDSLAEMEDGAPIRELGRRLGLPKSTVQRLLASLEAEGLVHQIRSRGSYRLSTSIYRLVAKINARLDLRSRALPVMRQARAASRQSVALMVREGHNRLCPETLDGLEPLRGSFRVGDRLPLYCGSAGKLLLAYMPEVDVENVIALTGLSPLTTYTISDPSTFRRELESIRRVGYAVSDQERYVGLCSVAAPIREFTGRVVGALTIAGPPLPFQGDSLCSMIRLVQSSADQISRDLGWEPTPPERVDAPSDPAVGDG